MPNYDLYSDKKTEKLAKHGVLKFTSYGKEMHVTGTPFILEVFHKLGISREDLDIVFTHASSSKMWEMYGKLVGIDHKMYHIFSETGNLVSASIPVSIGKALDNKKLKRDDKVMLWIGSAGASTAAVQFNY